MKNKQMIARILATMICGWQTWDSDRFGIASNRAGKRRVVW